MNLRLAPRSSILKKTQPRKPAPAPAPAPAQVYLSYSRKDRALVEQFRDHLVSIDLPLQLYYDLDIQPGEEWDRQLRSNLAASRAVLFFLSPDALHSKYMWQVEAPAAMAMAAQRRIAILPVLLRDCAWSETPLARFQMLPRDLRPIANARPRGAAWQRLLAELLAAVDHLAKPMPEEPAPAADSLPVGVDRLRFALYAVMDQPAEMALLEGLDRTELAILWQQAAQDGASPHELLQALAHRHDNVLPHPLWAAWVATVQPDKLGP